MFLQVPGAVVELVTCFLILAPFRSKIKVLERANQMAIRYGKELIDQIDQLSILPNSLAIWGLGQMGVALKGDMNAVVYIDPVLSSVVSIKEPQNANKFSRAFPPPVLPEEITNAAFVLCTHDHLDHTDPFTLGPIAQASPQAKFFASGWASSLMDEARIAPDRRISLEVGKPTQIGNMKITAVPAAHYTMEFSSQNGYRSLSYLVEWNGVTFFHSGDTLVTPEYIEWLGRLPKVDVAILAVNGRDAYRESENVIGNMTPLEAAWLVKTLNWNMIIIGHNDLFRWNALPAVEITAAMQHFNPYQPYITLQPGQLYYFVR
jgi:L-ascorbate 6-phosphate lactonase